MAGISFIVNPAAGGRRGRRPDQLLEDIRLRFPDAECLLTSTSGEAEELARARRGLDNQRVIAVGGDGTVSEVARGLVGGFAVLGVIPQGSGNDFARMLGMPTDSGAALAHLAQARAMPCDVGRVRIQHADDTESETHFINSLGLGFEAEVADRAARARWCKGFWRYLIAALGLLPVYRAPLMRLAFDDQRIDAPQFLVALGNGRWAGGGFMLAPKAALDDGWLELTRADALPLWRLLTIFPRVFSGRHLDCRRVHADRVNSIRIECPSGCMVHGDGEVLARCAQEIEVKLLPGALQVLR
ncbi:MAG: diacylglycerol kinase family lipid kinase [Wenzhouxiangellaceae bacterium]|nr:MAG: diacylglycerol kinase family lipid kinase [Wenzhouxiangellaceae bacterium]